MLVSHCSFSAMDMKVELSTDLLSVIPGKDLDHSDIAAHLATRTRRDHDWYRYCLRMLYKILTRRVKSHIINALSTCHLDLRTVSTRMAL